MMGFLNNNALFLASCRERTRPAWIFSTGLLVFLVVILIYINCLTNTNTLTVRAEDFSIAWKIAFVIGIAILQGFILLLFGPISAYRFAAREITGGTLDFHRASPTSYQTQLLGFIVGGPCLEWLFFNLLALVQIAICATQPTFLIPYCMFYFSLLLCGVFYISIGTLMGLMTNPRRSWMGILQIFFILYISIAIFGFQQLSCWYHLTWFPAFNGFFESLTGRPAFFYEINWILKEKYVLNNIFGYTVPSMLLQIFVQLPLIGIAFSSIARIILNPERPVLSKGQSLLFIFFLLFLFTGSSFSHIMAEYVDRYSWSSINPVTGFFICFAFACGIVGALVVTPSQLLYVKGIARFRKFGLRVRSGDDNSSNFIWNGIYGLIVLVVFMIYIYLYQISWINAAVGYCTLMGYTTFFSSFYEYFRLSKYNRKTIVFVTVLVILWIIIPIFGIILHGTQTQILFGSFSPLFGGLKSASATLSNSKSHFSNISWFTLIVSVSLAVIATVLAFFERRHIRQRILK